MITVVSHIVVHVIYVFILITSFLCFVVVFVTEVFSMFFSTVLLPFSSLALLTLLVSEYNCRNHRSCCYLIAPYLCYCNGCRHRCCYITVVLLYLCILPCCGSRHRRRLRCRYHTVVVALMSSSLMTLLLSSSSLVYHRRY